MQPKDSGWVKGRIPARIAGARASVAGKGPESSKRIARIRQLQSVGLPLAEALRKQSASASAMDLPRLGGAVALVLGFLIAAFGIVGESFVWSLGGGAAGVGGAIALMVFRRPPVETLLQELLIDAENLDRVLEKHSGILPKDAVEVLVKMKGTLALVLTVSQTKDGSGATLEDLLFARELVARYIPDACRHYAELQLAARSPGQLPGERTADESLLDQLSILSKRLDRMHEAIVAAKADQLLHHEHFIRTKR
jgi:hypothetical protein